MPTWRMPTMAIIFEHLSAQHRSFCVFSAQFIANEYQAAGPLWSQKYTINPAKTPPQGDLRQGILRSVL